MSERQLLKRIKRLQRAGVIEGVSRRVLTALGNDTYWLNVIGKLESAHEWAKIADILQFHQQMHEGRPAQRINVTSFGVQVTTDEIERVRELVRSLAPVQRRLGEGSVPFADASPQRKSESIESTPNVLTERGGGKRWLGGVG